MDKNFTSSIKDFFLDMDYAAIVRVFYDNAPNSCAYCYSPRDCCRCSIALGKCIGEFV